jgi:tetratricopeptide (TPR) repeat protein
MREEARVEPLLDLVASKVASQAFAQAVKAIRGNRKEYRLLVASVRKETGIRPGRAYRRWFGRSDTWDGLVSDTPAGYEALVNALDRELERALHLPGRLPSARQRRERAEKLVDATLRALISSLDASAAVAVSDYRIRRDLEEVKELLENRESLEARLAEVPPTAADPLRLLAIEDSVLAGRLLGALTASSEPTETVRALLAELPPWLQSAPARAWLALAEVANAHGAAGVASTLFERVADLGLDRARHLARAALAAAAADDPPRAQALISRAESMGGGAPVVPIVSAAIANDVARLADFARHFDALDSTVLSLVGEALLHEKGLQEAIGFYRRAAARYPDLAGLHLRLAALLLGAVQEAGPIRAPAARRDVRMLALHARDLRRNWRGPSGDAVVVACDLAIAFNDPAEALRLGQAPPDGEATGQEAATPAVRRAVFYAALADGQTDLAERLLGEIEDPVDRVIGRAELLAASGMNGEAASQYRQAWKLVRNDEDRMAVWLGLARLGEDLPDRPSLEARDDPYSVTVLAEADLARSSVDTAVGRLRRWRNRSPQVARRLAELYVRLEEVETAVATLEGAAAQFHDPRFLVTAAELLAAGGELGKAAEIAARALPAVGEESQLRVALHEVLIAEAQQAGNWLEMEARVRALIDEQGASPHRRWLLVGALFNGRQLEHAWTELQADPALQPDNEPRARVWMDLHARFRPGPELAEELLALIDRFGPSADLTAAAITRYLLMTPQHGDVPEDVAERWRSRMSRFLEEHPAHPGFFAITIPTDPDQLRETLRPYLEPGSQSFMDLREQVNDVRLPYGVLATNTGRPYAAALLQRAAGCYPIHPADEEVAHDEVLAARQAVNGPVVVDTSALTVASYLPELWPRLLSTFTQGIMPLPTRIDLVRAADDYRVRPGGMLGWDPRSGQPIATETDDEVHERLQTQSQWMLEATQDLDVLDWPRLGHLPEPDEVGDEASFLPWLAPLDLALARGHPLMADDVVLRMVARSVGVPSFGTVALLYALVDGGAVAASELTDALDELRRQYCVDFPLDLIALNRIGSQDKWAPGPAAYPFTRRTTWLASDRAYRAWHALCRRAAAANPRHVPGWLSAAIYGAARGKEPDQVTTIAAALLFSTTLTVGAPADIFPDLLAAARSAASDIGGGDLLPVAITQMLGVMTPVQGPEGSARAVLALAASLDEQDRALVRKIVFGPNEA